MKAFLWMTTSATQPEAHLAPPLRQLVLWSALGTAGTLAVGLPLTWRYAHWAGVWSGLTATGLLWLTLIATSWLVTVVSRLHGIYLAGQLFIGLSMIRAAVTAGLVLLAQWLTGLPPRVMLFWFVFQYVAMLVAEVFWILRASRRQAEQTSQG